MVTERPQSPSSVPLVTAADPPEPVVRVRVHCCTNDGDSVMFADKTNVFGLSVPPFDQVANRYPALGVALTVMLRPQSPSGVPTVIDAVPPVAWPIVREHDDGSCWNEAV